MSTSNGNGEPVVLTRVTGPSLETELGLVLDVFGDETRDLEVEADLLAACAEGVGYDG